MSSKKYNLQKTYKLITSHGFVLVKFGEAKREAKSELEKVTQQAEQPDIFQDSNQYDLNEHHSSQGNVEYRILFFKSMLILNPVLLQVPKFEKALILKERDKTSKNAYSITIHQKIIRIGNVAMEISMDHQVN